MKSDYCNFNWWNSCLCFDAMFKYVNLMIIVLLMLNLHAWNVYMGILCVFLKFDEEWCYCCWIVDEFMVNCCCCCYEMCCWWIDAMSFHNSRIVVWIELLLRVFGETLWNCWIVLKWCFDFKFCMVLSVFYVHIPVNNLWDEFGHFGDQILGFLVKKGWNPRASVQNSWLFA